MYLIKIWTVARNGGQIESKEGVASSKLLSVDVASFVLKNLTQSSKQITVTSHVATITETRLERFRRDLLSVYVQCEKTQVVFCVERVLSVGSIVCVVVAVTQHDSLRQAGRPSKRFCESATLHIAVSKTLCSRLFATDTRPFPFPAPLCDPSAR